MTDETTEPEGEPEVVPKAAHVAFVTSTADGATSTQTIGCQCEIGHDHDSEGKAINRQVAG